MAKGGGLLAILGSPKGEPGKGESGSGGADDESDLELNAMGDLLDAIGAKDRAAMKSAFRRAHDACASAKATEADEEI